MTPTDEAVLEAFPHDQIDADNVDHYRGILERRLLINRCTSCGAWHAPPAAMCPTCWSDDVHPTEVSGDGVVYLLMFLHQGPGATPDAPYPVATIELSEQPGVRFTSTLVGCSRAEMHVGMPVRLTWIDRNGSPFPAFEPASTS